MSAPLVATSQPNNRSTPSMAAATPSAASGSSLGLDSAAYDAAYAEQSGAATQKHIAESRQWLGMVQGQGFPTLALEFDHPEQPGQRAVQRLELGEWLGDVSGWKQQLAEWVEQIAALNPQQAGDADPSCGPDGCELPPR